MRHVVNADEVYHLYANQRNPDGPFTDHARNGSENRSFAGTRAYSYSTVIAEYVAVPKVRKADDREHVVMLKADMFSYSRTTDRHLNEILRAFNGHSRPLFVVPHIDFSSPQEEGRKVEFFGRDLHYHLLNVNYLRQQAVETIKDGYSWKPAKDAVVKWLLYVKLFRLSRHLNDVDKKIYQWWIDNGEETGINKEAAKLCYGPIDPNHVTDDERAVINEMVKASADDLSIVFRSYWGYGKKPEDLGKMDPKPMEYKTVVYRDNEYGYPRPRVETHVTSPVNVRLRAKKLGDSREKWNNAEKHHRYLMSNSEVAEISKLPADVRYNNWKEDGNRKWLQPQSYLRAATDWDVREYFNLGNQTFFKGYGGYGSNFKLCRLNGNDEVITSDGVRIREKEFALYWTRFIRPLWNVRFNKDMYIPLFKLMRYNKSHRISRAYSLDDANMQYGVFKVGCHLLIFDDLADVAHRMGLEPTVLQWKPTCLVAPAKSTEAVNVG